MALIGEINKWKNKKVLIIGEALIDKYIFGYANSISPDAPVPNIKIEKISSYLGGIGLVLKFIKSLGGIPEVCTIIGNDYDGNYFLKEIKSLGIDHTGILIDNKLSTPQITRIKAMNQHVLRLESDYSKEIFESTIEQFIKIIKKKPQDLGSIIILDYGVEGLFTDIFIQTLLEILNDTFENIPIIARPNLANYYLYENIDLIKINLQKALQILSIDCCTETSVSIVGKKILNTSNSKNVLLNEIEGTSYLFLKNFEKVEKISTILAKPVRSYVSVGSVIMSVLGLTFASKCPVQDAVKLALYAASLSATLPPVEFFNAIKLQNYISTYLKK
ncbi:MAG: bifunctional heptose 7-phosphate kinase/heptose 1-phosphate adenyltransferase [Promethearchaeota archaeon]